MEVVSEPGPGIGRRERRSHLARLSQSGTARQHAARKRAESHRPRALVERDRNNLQKADVLDVKGEPMLLLTA